MPDSSSGRTIATTRISGFSAESMIAAANLDGGGEDVVLMRRLPWPTGWQE